MAVIFQAEAAVTDDLRLSLWTHSAQGASFEQVRAAMSVLRDELNRILEAGPTRCPFRAHNGAGGDPDPDPERDPEDENEPVEPQFRQ